MRRSFQVDRIYEPSFLVSTLASTFSPTRAPLSEGAAAETGKRYGIAIVGNDKIIDWLLPFLESYLATNSTLPIYLIPMTTMSR